jgi:hypothetical protein
MSKPRILRLNGGHLNHAVDADENGRFHSRKSKAVCGARPGKTNGMRDACWHYECGVVTCQKCLEALKKRSAEASPSRTDIRNRLYARGYRWEIQFPEAEKLDPLAVKTLPEVSELMRSTYPNIANYCVVPILSPRDEE